MIVIGTSDGWKSSGVETTNETTPGVWTTNNDTMAPVLSPSPIGRANAVGKIQIKTLEDLNLVRTNPNGNYVLMNDIDASATATWNDGQGWEPIGTYVEPFRGSFDGNGYTISGLRYSSENSALKYIGLFGCLFPTAEIRNLKVNADIICSGTYVGILAGISDGALVVGCSTSGSVTGGSVVGGIIGLVTDGAITFNCHSSASVSGHSLISGFVGMLNDSLIQDCYANGEVSGNAIVGGLVASMTGSIYESYSSVVVSYTTPVQQGGLVGQYTSGIIENAYWDIERSTMATSNGGGTGLTSAQMKRASFFVGFDFGSVIEIDYSVMYGVNGEATVMFSEMSSDFVGKAFKNGMWNLANERKLSLMLTAFVPPSRFGTFRFYIKDYLGKQARYRLTNKDIGKKLLIPLETLKYDSGFNKSSVVEVGFEIGSPNDGLTSAGLTVYDVAFGTQHPTYTTAQAVIDQIGLVDTDKSPLIISEITDPRLSVVNNWIIQAECIIDSLCRETWRENFVVDETQTKQEPWKGRQATVGRHPTSMYDSFGGTFGRGAFYQLNHRNIREFDAEKGDKIQIRGIGSDYKDVSNTPNAFWFDYPKGHLYVRQFQISTPFAAIKVSYRYGIEDVPEDISRATTLKVACDVVRTDWYRQKLMSGGTADSMKSEMVKSWEEDVKTIISGKQSVFLAGGI